MIFTHQDNATDKAKQEVVSSPVVPHLTPREAEWLDRCLSRGKYELFNEIVHVTPAIATAILERNTHNRPFSKIRADRYAVIMKEGRWRLTPEAILIDSTGTLQDGQHRLGGAILSGETVKMMIWFGCDPEDFAVLNTGAARTAANAAAIAGYSNYAMRSAVAGHIARMWGEGGSRNKPDTHKVFQVVKRVADEDMDEALKFGNSVKDHKVCNASAASLAYWHIKKNTAFPEKIAAFAKGFITGAELGERSAILRVRNVINTAIIEPNSQQRTFKQAAAIVLAWNSWLRSSYLNSVSWPHITKLPEVK